MSDNSDGIGRQDKFLLQEHHEIWEFVRKITDERNGWLKFYWAIITASLAATGFLYRHFVPGTLPSELDKFWTIAAVILFALTIVSIAVSMILFGLRKKSIEYRNHLNRLRAVFVSNKPGLSGYLPMTPNQRFFKEKEEGKKKGKKKRFGVENTILYLISVVASLTFGAFVFSFIQVIPRLCGTNLFEHRCCISISVLVLTLFIALGLILWRGWKYDNELDSRDNTGKKNESN